MHTCIGMEPWQWCPRSTRTTWANLAMAPHRGGVRTRLSVAAVFRCDVAAQRGRDVM